MTRVWVGIWLWLSAACATAQTYIQVEAHPSLDEALEAAERYDGMTGSAAGFRLGGSWYAVVLGPYEPEGAETELRLLRRTGRIPRDSYLTTLENYGPRFYPGEAAAPDQAETAIPEEPLSRQTLTAEPLPDETPAEARRTERLLSAEERALIQRALADAGVYSGPIDAAFGQGTRQAMAAWQSARGHQRTGILTTAQRAALVEEYRAVFEGLGMRRVADEAAGIEVAMPTAVVAREEEDSPFVRYGPTGQMPVRVLLISREGGRGALAGLYELMQTLEIVPVEGPRTRGATSFEIEGRNSEIVSTTWAETQGGEIKGFTLVWPAGDEERRSRVLEEMRATFTRLEGVLPTPVTPEEAAPDLLAGLEVRRPERDRSGFFVDGSGAVLTTHEAVRACERVTLEQTVEAEVAAADEGLGLALLKPQSRLSPIRYARFRATPPQLRSEIAVAGYPFGGILPEPSLNFGRLEAARGLDGDAAFSRLVLASEPGETGGPVFDEEGSVVGILQPPDGGTRRLPDEVSFATSAGSINEFLSAAGLSAEASQGGAEIPPEELTRLAADMTVLVGCWN